MSQSESKLVTQEDGAVTVVQFAQPTLLDAFHVSQVENELVALVTKQGRRRIVLDLSTIQMLSSRALGVLLTVHRELGKVDGKLVIAGIDPKLYRVFKITNLQSVFAFFDNAEQARAFLAEEA